jgi:SWI/SNF-related matrix-associated actin-dependent regulator of chromatin subfamily A3
MEEKTEFATTFFTRCAENAWWDPRTSGLQGTSMQEISGGFLCDTVGLGKTLSMIALCVSRPPEDMNAYKTLVLCPPSILVQWKREIEKFSSLRVFEYHGKKKQGVTRDTLRAFDIILTTYTTYLQNHIFTHILEHDGTYTYAPITWHRVIYDESHTMSERFTRTQTIIHARHRWCVTATPFNNLARQFKALGLPSRHHEYGFPALYYTLEPLMIRHTQKHSTELPELAMEDAAVQFQTEGEKRLYDLAHARVKHDMHNVRNMHVDALKVHSHVNALRRLCTAGAWSLESLFSSRPSQSPSLKPDFNLVAPHDDDDMCPICMNIYEQPMVTTCNHWFCADCIAMALNMPPGKCPMCRNPLRAQDLRAGVLFGQVPDDDPMEDIVHAGTIECSSKLNHLMTMLESMRDQDATSKALVFCESSTTIPVIMDALKETGFKARCIHGSMAALQRGNAIKAFQEDACTTVFVSSLRSAAAGINLTAANHIFFLGPVMNQANYTQAIGRAHRTGQARRVTVHRLFMEGTIEDQLRTEQHWTLEKLCRLFV